MTNLEKVGASAFGRLGGKTKSAAKAKAARENAKKPRPNRRKRFTGTTVEGVLNNGDGSPYVGDVNFFLMSTPRLIGCEIVLTEPLRFTTDRFGGLEARLYSGDYALRFSDRYILIRVPQRMSGHARPRRLPMRVNLADVTITKPGGAK